MAKEVIGRRAVYYVNEFIAEEVVKFVPFKGICCRRRLSSWKLFENKVLLL